MSTFAFDELTRAVEERLVDKLALRPLALAPALREAQGSFRGQPVRLAARAYTGPGVAYARFVTMVGGGLDIGNAVALAAPRLPVPILGLDLVALGRDSAVVVADLSPVRDGDAPAGLPAAAAALPALDPPAWARPWLSARPLLTRIGPADRDAAAVGVTALADAFAEGVSRASADPARESVTRERQRAYALSHRQDDRGLALLDKVFGAAFARSFVSTVMFPDGAAA